MAAVNKSERLISRIVVLKAALEFAQCLVELVVMAELTCVRNV